MTARHAVQEAVVPRTTYPTPPAFDDGAVLGDEEGGRMVRAYTITTGRTHATAFDRIATVRALAADVVPRAMVGLNPEQAALLRICRTPVGLAELAARLGLPLNMVRILLDDLIARHLVAVTNPVHVRHHDPAVLLAALRGLQAL